MMDGLTAQTSFKMREIKLREVDEVLDEQNIYSLLPYNISVLQILIATFHIIKINGL